MNPHNRFFKRFLAGGFLLLGLLCIGCNEDRQVKNLKNELNGHSSARKIWAVQILAEMKDPAAIEAVIAALEDKDSSVRRVSARALGRMNGPRVMDALRNTLEHWDADVRHEAAWALWKATDDSGLLVALRHRLEGL